jgi:glycosyltransferase involved in cell wall biosynthesis
MPSFGFAATRLTRLHDVASIHLPQFDATGLAARARLMDKPSVLTYHCDLRLPAGVFNRVVDRVVFVANFAAATLADRIVAYTSDYVEHSRLLSAFRSKIDIIPPPVRVGIPGADEVDAFRSLHGGTFGPILGFAARFAAEKGVEVLLRALPRVLDVHPRLKVLFAGPYQNVLGEQAYRRRLQPTIESLGGHWEFLGTLKPSDMSTFFSACDALVVPSLNSTESFGLVQVEAMLCGTPVVATNLPGVREPVRMTGMGEVVPVRDSGALAEALLRVLADRGGYVRSRSEVEAVFDFDVAIDAYESLFTRLVNQRLGRRVVAAGSSASD